MRLEIFHTQNLKTTKFQGFAFFIVSVFYHIALSNLAALQSLLVFPMILALIHLVKCLMIDFQVRASRIWQHSRTLDAFADFLEGSCTTKANNQQYNSIPTFMEREKQPNYS